MDENVRPGGEQADIREKYEYYDRLFRRLIADEESIHEKNQKRIKGGIQCLVWIPMIFLALMFLTDAEKVIFLILWIVSLFFIAGYLITVEYADFNTQERIREYRDSGLDGGDVDSLIGGDVEAFEAAVDELLDELARRKMESRERMLNFLDVRKDRLTGGSLKGGQDGKHH